jgi:hypothetical protein
LASLVSVALRRARRAPLSALVGLATAAFAVWFVVRPLFAARYPPMTDLPFHAASIAAIHGYGDASLHFKEQFSLHPFAIPYMSMYWIGSLFMYVVDVVTATKIAAAVMLLLLPAGLAVLFVGMKKSASLGAMLGLAGVWCALTHWGFLNFVGAVGLFAMALGEALLVVDRPTRARRVALAVTLVVLFFTHVFRFPFAICAVVGAGVVCFPATRRLRPLVSPMLPSLALFAVWWFVRPKALEGGLGALTLHTERIHDVPRQLVNGFLGDAEQASFGGLASALVRVALVAAAIALVRGFVVEPAPRERLFRLGAAVAVACSAAVFFVMYLVLPMQIGAWWYVFPREATSAAFVALALFPDLPRAVILRAPLLLLIALPLAKIAGLVERDYAQFDRATADFDRVTRTIPKAPKLLYLIFDHSGSMRANTPFIHLPAYVQATHGGWLSFHFAVWGASPVLYRDPSERGAVVPPPVPLRWEWMPQRFDLKRQGPFFDWFLVRDVRPPDRIFQGDPSIARVDHAGEWWLFHRKPTAPR